MHTRMHLAGPVALIADAGSALADRVAAGLAEEGLRIVRAGPSQRTLTDVVASVVLVEATGAPDTLRAILDQASQPVLVLVATPELGRQVIPQLSMWYGLGLASETMAVIAWRITQLVGLSQMQVIAAHRDPLTGLLNRRAFETRLRQVTESVAAGEVVGLVMIDLDRFKVINDRFGHAAGDNVLRALGELLPRVLAPGDQVARLGGDEFGCLMSRYDTESVRSDSERLLKEIATLDVAALLGRSSCPSLGASAGLTLVRPTTAMEQLMAEADLAMYEAKNSGRNRLVIHGDSAEAAGSSTVDLRLRHFENSARLATERLVEMITLKSRRLVETAKQEANTCSLTGLHNRRYFDVEFPGEIDRARRQGRPLSLALIDIDHFRLINKKHGWPTGDRVLRAFADVLRDNVRATDWVARYGGEEFVIVMPDTALASAVQVAERVRKAFSSVATESVEGQRVAATLSIGVALLLDCMGSTTAFVQQASKALLCAKESGRNRVEQAHADHGPGLARPAVYAGDPFELERFVEAQAGVYEDAVTELRRGRKRSHWMWFVFPQLRGLGRSSNAFRYGITEIDEARAYLAHPVLGPRLLECAAVLEQLDGGRTVSDIFRDPDDVKLRSSLTLFARVAGSGSVFERLLAKYYGGEPDDRTVAMLGLKDRV
jgi:two-component system, cell cycle response regulator